MNMDIALMENLKPFMELFIKEPNVNTAKRAALVHAQASGIYNKLDAAGKKEFEQFCSYLWMMAAKPRAEYQKHQLQNPIALKKWFWDTRPDSKYDPQELAMGTAQEAKEHGVPAIIAKKIAKDHLDEIPNYYSLLNMVERSVDPRRKNPIPYLVPNRPTLIVDTIESFFNIIDMLNNARPENKKFNVIRLPVRDPDWLKIVSLGDCFITHGMSYALASKIPSRRFGAGKILPTRPFVLIPIFNNNILRPENADSYINLTPDTTRAELMRLLDNALEKLYSTVTSKKLYSEVKKSNPSSLLDTKYMKPFIEKPKKEKEPERTINYADFNQPRLYKQSYNSQAKNPSSGKPKLLIVEDNKIVAEMNNLLAGADFERKIAYNGTEGIANLAWADVVCTDGDFEFNTEFYAALKASGKPFIINSGNLNFKNQGELEFVYKPASVIHALMLLKQAAMQKKNPTKAMMKSLAKFAHLPPAKLLQKYKDMAGSTKSLIVQSVVFPTPKFTIASAKAWLKKHGFKRPAADKKPNTIRFRQQEPKRFKGYFTHKYPNGVSVIVGTLTKNFQGKYKVFHRNKPMSFTDLTVRGAAKK